MNNDKLGTAPSDIFMIRNAQSISNDRLVAIYNTITLMNTNQQILDIFKYDGIKGLTDYGTSTATLSHLSSYINKWTSNNLIGWQSLSTCNDCLSYTTVNCTSTNQYNTTYWNSLKNNQAATSLDVGNKLFIFIISFIIHLFFLIF